MQMESSLWFRAIQIMSSTVQNNKYTFQKLVCPLWVNVYFEYFKMMSKEMNSRYLSTTVLIKQKLVYILQNKELFGIILR